MEQQVEADSTELNKRQDDYPTKVEMVQQQQEHGSVDTTQESSISDHDQDEDDDDEDEDDADAEDDVEEPEEEVEIDCKELLERAHDRIARQHLQEEVDKLKELLERKDTEIERLTGQLRRAITTKSDLVAAHSDLEKFHHDELQRKDTDVQSLKQSNASLLEEYSNKEKELLNELVMLTEKLFESEKRHRLEREDLTRRHTNQMLEKDLEVAQLTVKLQIAAMKDEQGSVTSTSKGTKKSKAKSGLLSWKPPFQL
jgi:hypothetical protein